MELKTFSDYQKKALETNTYPDDKGLLLVAIGLGEEFGELIEKLYQNRDLYIVTENPINGCHFQINMDKKAELIELIKKEIGDVFWYLAMNIYYLNVENDFIICTAETNNLDIDIFSYCFSGAYFKYLGLIKKRFRDNLKNDKKCKCFLKYLYANLLAICCLFNFNIKEILELNIEKLADRKKRGKIQGNGDNR